MEDCCGKQQGTLSSDNKSQVIKNFYDTVATGAGPYSKEVNKFSPDGPTEEIFDCLLQNNKTAILDIGCGMGTTLLKIAQKYEPAELLIGVDFSEKMIQQAKKDRSALPEKLSKKMGFFTANACALPYMDNQFDFVYSECVLNLVKDRDRAISEIFRVLKPNGIFCYTDFVSYERIPEVIRNDLSLVSGCRAGSLTMTQNLNVLKRSGFVNIYTKDFSYEKTKRYKEQLQSSVKLQRDFALLKQEKPDVFDFLENKVGYFFITGVKK